MLSLEDTGNSNSGAAYVYNLDGTGEIEFHDNDTGDNFGSSVAVGYGKVVVGADQDNESGTNAGAIYVYNLDGSGETKVVHLILILLMNLVIHVL